MKRIEHSKLEIRFLEFVFLILKDFREDEELYCLQFKVYAYGLVTPGNIYQGIISM